MTNKQAQQLKKDLTEDLNKILIKLDGLKLISEVNVHYGEHTTDYIPDSRYPDDTDYGAHDLNMDKVRLLTLKTAIFDLLNNKNELYEMFDEYKLSNGD